jgi:uncharacterized protein (TIGR04255 family)
MVDIPTREMHDARKVSGMGASRGAWTGESEVSVAMQPLPDFSAPPVVEVALSVQFDRLTKLRTPQMGLLWHDMFRERFPSTEDHPPLESVIERFDTPTARSGIPRIELREYPPTPRCWFLNPPGTELIQVQQDRFVHNWRKAGTAADYPRYEHVRKTFESELNRFNEYINRESLGAFVPNQCDITYVNHIAAGNLWKSHGELNQVLTVFERRYSDDFLSAPEDAVIRMRFVIPDKSGQPLGRLHATLKPGYRNGDHQPFFLLDLTARGRPIGDGIAGVLAFLDLGREWVVRGFASMTTQTMHKEWGRKNGA